MLDNKKDFYKVNNSNMIFYIYYTGCPVFPPSFTLKESKQVTRSIENIAQLTSLVFCHCDDCLGQTYQTTSSISWKVEGSKSLKKTINLRKDGEICKCILFKQNNISKKV